MRYYQISEARVKRILHSPKRIEEGIAPKTIAVMQSAGSPKHPYELWVMLQNVRHQSGVISQKVISVWRYPGITKPNDATLKNILEKEYGEFSGGD